MRGESALSTTYSDIGKRTVKRKKGYIDHPRDRSKLTCLINGLINSSDECKVLKYFGTKYAKGRPFKEIIQDTTSNKRSGKIKR